MRTKLLACGVVAGPLFVTTWAAQAFTRHGFDPTRHPLSLLALGDLGWIQVANFVVSGALVAACAVGLHRHLRSGRGRVWGPLLVGLLGVGLIVAGVFTTDPGAGFPPGAPAGAPDMTWHGMLHEVGFLLSVPGMLAGAVVFAVRFRAAGEKAWARVFAGSVVAVVALAMYPTYDGYAVRIVVATAALFGLVAALAIRYIADGRVVASGFAHGSSVRREARVRR